jgi:biotin operon repressor
MTRDKHIQFLREKGLNITENGDGSFTAAKPRMFRTDL